MDKGFFAGVVWGCGASVLALGVLSQAVIPSTDGSMPSIPPEMAVHDERTSDVPVAPRGPDAVGMPAIEFARTDTDIAVRKEAVAAEETINDTIKTGPAQPGPDASGLAALPTRANVPVPVPVAGAGMPVKAESRVPPSRAAPRTAARPDPDAAPDQRADRSSPDQTQIQALRDKAPVALAHTPVPAIAGALPAPLIARAPESDADAAPLGSLSSFATQGSDPARKAVRNMFAPKIDVPPLSPGARAGTDQSESVAEATGTEVAQVSTNTPQGHVVENPRPPEAASPARSGSPAPDTTARPVVAATHPADIPVTHSDAGPSAAVMAADTSDDAQSPETGRTIAPATGTSRTLTTPRAPSLVRSPPLEPVPDLARSAIARNRVPATLPQHRATYGEIAPRSVESGRVPADARPPVERFARPFDTPVGKPLVTILLEDTGGPGLDREALASLPFPVTFAIDPAAPDAVPAAAIYRAAGQEVVALFYDGPGTTPPQPLDARLATIARTLPEAVGIMTAERAQSQTDESRETRLPTILRDQGRGLISWDGEFDQGSRIARQTGVWNARIFRRLDRDDDSEPAIRRALDRAAFKAAQNGRVVVVGQTRPKTVAAIVKWVSGPRAASVALAPVSAVMVAN